MSNKRVDAIMINQKINDEARGFTKQNNKLTLQFPTSQTFQNKEIALAYLGIYYSWRNVTSANKNKTFGYRWVDDVVYPVILPDGFYTMEDINNYMQAIVMEQNGHFVKNAEGNNVYFINIVTNPTYYSATLTCKPIAVPAGGTNPNTLPLGDVPQLVIYDVSDAKFGLLLGLNTGSYPPTAHTTSTFYQNSQNVPNISPVTTINVNCNLAESRTSRFINSIYQFSPTIGYAQYITVTPPYTIFYDVSDGSYSNINVFFTDQNGDPLDVLDTNINVTLLVRDR